MIDENDGDSIEECASAAEKTSSALAHNRFMDTRLATLLRSYLLSLLPSNCTDRRLEDGAAGRFAHLGASKRLAGRAR